MEIITVEVVAGQAHPPCSTVRPREDAEWGLRSPPLPVSRLFHSIFRLDLEDATLPSRQEFHSALHLSFSGLSDG
jgi:hypothetical protein